ncbi:MAG: bifunctional 2-polyprenyl-6-hydroxyphenol methylase/3-demethylubiquinol 3-O-methyltransferase UbiG [Alphaproteobacteria bacterium]|nr:bifunctional 2-polyprenyl-6-hydroxyphenol methylase/3-demethylubiquinol 3-O-methyltransferase UbiG [Alphaproteobacteria bacterium]
MIRTKPDAEELIHFQNLSAHWWEGQGPFKQLHAINPFRIAFLKEKVGIHFGLCEHEVKPLQGLRILDVGCGGGVFCEPLARLGAEVIGIDLIPENIRVAKRHAEEMGLPLTYLSCAVEDLPQEFPLFDVVIASEVIEHITDHEGFLETCVARLKPHGGMMVTTFNQTLKSYLLGIIAAEYVLRWAPPGTHSWAKFRSPQDLSRILLSHGFGNQDITGLSYSPVRGWGFSSSIDVNYFLWAGR